MTLRPTLVILALVVALLVAAPPLRRALLRGVLRVFGVQAAFLTEAVVGRLGTPLVTAAWLCVLAAVAFFFLPLVPRWLANLLLALATLAALHLLIQMLDLGLYRFYLRERRGLALAPLVEGVLVGALYLVAVLLVLENVLGINVLPLLATSTVVTLVLGLALQDTLGNVFAGISLSLDRGFRPGDWIQLRLDAMNVREGEVLQVGWRSTRLRTAADTEVMIPNNLFTRNELVNLSLPTTRVLVIQEVPIDRQVAPEDAIPRLAEAVRQCPGVEPEPEPVAGLVRLAVPANVYRVAFAVAGPERREAVVAQALAMLWHAVRDLESPPSTRGEAAPDRAAPSLPPAPGAGQPTSSAGRAHES